MKKIWIKVFLMSILIILVPIQSLAEQENSEKVSYDQNVEADFEWLTIEKMLGKNSNSYEIIQNLELPVEGINGCNIYWDSSNPKVILNSGVITNFFKNATDVTMTAHIVSGEEEKIKKFHVKVFPTQSDGEAMHILQIGDSNTEYGKITQSMNQILKQRYGNYGDGFLTLCKDFINIAPKYFSIDYNGQWLQYDLVFGAGPLSNAQDTPFGLYVQNQNKGDSITVRFLGSAVDLYYLEWEEGGNFRVSIDDYDYGEVSQKSSRRRTNKVVYEGLSYGLHTITIQNVSGKTNFFGADYRVDQAISRKNISTWGKAGIQAKQYAMDLNETVFKTALSCLDPDIVVILLGTNDNGGAACPPETFEGYLDIIIQRVKSALPDTEIWVVSTFETVNSKERLHSYWDTSFPNAAKKNAVHYWSMGEWFGPYSTELMEDNWHSNLTASRQIAEKMYEVLKGGVNVVGRNIVTVKNEPYIKSISGTEFSELPLPKQVMVELDDLQHSQMSMNVLWSSEGYHTSAGYYTLSGTLDISKSKRIYNPYCLKANINVSLEKEAAKMSSMKKIKKGQIYTVKNLKYRVTSTKKRTVSVVKSTKKNLRKLVVPSTIRIEEKHFKVTKICKNAFFKNKNLKKVTIGKNVTIIGKNAFYKANKLQEIFIKSKRLKTVGKNAFYGISKKAIIRTVKSKRKAYRRLLKMERKL